MQKRCSCCGAEKPLDEFYTDPRRKDGRRSKCKACYPRAEWKGRTPEQCERRAMKRRERGEYAGEYKPQAVRNAEAAAKRAAEKAAKHDEHVKLWRRESRRLHSAHVAEWKRSGAKYRHQYNTDPVFATKQRLRTQLRKKTRPYPKLDDLMRGAIGRHGGSRTVERVCGYTIAQLVAHLEAQFTRGMTWDRFLAGDIHIDHKTPQAAFDLATIEGVRACWALDNLQPLWAEDNRAKSDRLADGTSVRAMRKVSGSLGFSQPNGLLRAPRFV